MEKTGGGGLPVGAGDRPTVPSTALKTQGRLARRRLGLASPRTGAPHLLAPVGLSRTFAGGTVAHVAFAERRRSQLPSCRVSQSRVGHSGPRVCEAGRSRVPFEGHLVCKGHSRATQVTPGATRPPNHFWALMALSTMSLGNPYVQGHLAFLISRVSDTFQQWEIFGEEAKAKSLSSPAVARL